MFVDVWLNRREDMAFFAYGYRRGDALEEVVGFEVDATDHREAAEIVFALGNLRTSGDVNGTMYPEDQRSISVGDVLVVYGKDEARGKVLACGKVGWDEIRMPLEVLA